MSLSAGTEHTSLPISLSFLTILPLAAIIFFIFYRSLSSPQHGRILPPGPAPRPIIGNLLDMPEPKVAQAYYTKLGQQYGPICSLTVFGTTIIVINDYAVARELLDKRANIYSGRPVMQMLGTLMGMDRTIMLEQPGDDFNRHRKIATQQLGSMSAVLKWSDEIDIEIRRYLCRTMERPKEFLHHMRVQAGTVMLKVLYGYEVDQHKPDPIIAMAHAQTSAVIQAGVPGAFLVDNVPVLKYVPEWFPGAGFQKQARAWRNAITRLTEVPFNFTRRQVAEGVAPKSAVSEMLSAEPKYPDRDIAWTASGMLAGAADTTLGTMEMFYLAMCRNPDVMAKAQQEIDRVVGHERFVSDLDRSSLPYTEALFKEVMRWEPLLEVNFPHCATSDDEYDGYFIPKGAVILSNTCGFMHDEHIYKDAMRFNPDRFLGAEPELNPFEVVWGHGRRTCPGRHMAYFTLWLQISRTIQVFNITTAPGQKLPEREFTWGVIRRPLPFETMTTIRSPEHEALVRAVEKEHPTPAHGSEL